MAIQKIFRNETDEEVHSDFLKFGRGEYKDRYLLEAKKQAKGWAIKTGPEYANYLVKKCLEKLTGPTQITGIIVSTMDLKEEIPFDIVKTSNFQGIRKTQINTEIKPEDILQLMNKYPRVFFALTFNGEDFKLKIKAKAPKSAKPGKENEDGPKADFCTLKTEDETIVKELFFDIENFKQANITHKIHVEGIIYPKNMDALKPAEIREQSKRKGKVIRSITVDGNKKTHEIEFTA